MAVVMSSNFYQANVWKDISKIVFSSPNMNSPSIAGTRSHILPGEGEIGTWYEDTSQMFRIEDHQYTTESDFFNYRMKSSGEVNLLSNPEYIDVKQINIKNSPDELVKYVESEFNYTKGINPLTSSHLRLYKNELFTKETNEITSYFIDEENIKDEVQ
jgi:hypothetical protein